MLLIEDALSRLPYSSVVVEVPPLGTSGGCIATIILGSVHAWETINRSEFNVGMMIKATWQISMQSRGE